MNAGRLPLFCDTAMAQRIERAEAQLIAKASEAAHRRRADDAGFEATLSPQAPALAWRDAKVS